ncbi:MAG: hypothetical protein WCJ01_02830 [Ignavibacteria bacterium]
MGQLFDLRQKIERIIKQKGLDDIDIKGKIGMKSGVVICFLKPETPDDPNRMARVKKAASEILNTIV